MFDDDELDDEYLAVALFDDELRILDAIGGEGPLVSGAYYWNGGVFPSDDDDFEESDEFWVRVDVAYDEGYENIF